MRTRIAILVILMTPCTAGAFGWAVFTGGGQVYRAKVGGTPESLYSGGASHATWSVDGRFIYFIKGNGQIWRMRNDGSEAQQIASGNNSGYNPIAAYRPDSAYLLYVSGKDFYKIRAADGQKTKIHTDARSYTGEIAIDLAGKRMAGRDTSTDLYAIAVGGGSDKYDGGCSASVSPNGAYLTANVGGHTKLRVYNFDGSTHKTLNAPSGKRWDNQKFSVNSDDHIVYKYDGDNAIGVVRVSDNQNTKICNKSSEYPDFFLGDLPPGQIEGQPPVPLITEPADGATYTPGAALTFAGQASDPEDGALPGAALSWQLDLVGDGAGPVHTATGTSGSYAFATTLSVDTAYELTVTATDSDGMTAKVSVSGWVLVGSGNKPPAVTAMSAVPNPALVGQTVELVCDAVDPDGDTLTYAWDFGDGNSASGVRVLHTFSAPGIYTIRVAVDDGQGHTVGDHFDLEVIGSDWIIMEAEDMTLSNYQVEDTLIATLTTGEASAVFPGTPGTYEVEIWIVKEDDGQPTLELSIAGQQVASIDYDLGNSSRDAAIVSFSDVTIEANAVVRLVGQCRDGAAARVDKVRFRLQTDNPATGGSGGSGGGGGGGGGTGGNNSNGGDGGSSSERFAAVGGSPTCAGSTVPLWGILLVALLGRRSLRRCRVSRACP